MDEEAKKVYIAALILERDGYAAIGLKDRVEEVNAELARIGADAKPKAQRRSTRVQKPAEER